MTPTAVAALAYRARGRPGDLQRRGRFPTDGNRPLPLTRLTNSQARISGH
ncbi:MAG TPA: hypothetical protein VG412_02150 [Acidimicrobiales bacterium]|nr:hypothetical protein [Acidimicrobiales bacterium]